MKTCPKCKEDFLVKHVKPGNRKVTCSHSKKFCDDMSASNSMDPGVVPLELQDLSMVEQDLISLVHPIISVFRVKGCQYGYRGNVINFPQNVSEVASKLPHRVEDLSSILTVRTRDEINPIDFYVRAAKVKSALEWLKIHNVYYHDIEISTENLAALPENDCIYTSIGKVGDNLAGNQPEEEVEIDTELEMEQQQLEESGVANVDDKLENIIEWPTIGNTPINEFNHVGYIAKAFPSLFPYGVADLNQPRNHKVTAINYFKHLLMYHDKRFSRHPRFRYFALNSVMRWSAIRDGGVCVQRNDDLKNMSLDEFKENLLEDPTLKFKLNCQNAKLRGTRSFWYSRGKELISMIEQIGMPTLFFTLSSADYHWPELFKLLAPEENIISMSESRRRQLVHENPLLVDMFFSERVDTYIKEVLQKKFSIDDIWFRVEYQHRGSPHIHGVAWCQNAPDVSDLANATDEQKQHVIDYFDSLISTIHPDMSAQPSLVHPCRKTTEDIHNKEEDLAQLLNKVQRHTKCTEGYCLKKKKMVFRYPMDLQEKSRLIINDKNELEFVPARNDPRLNKYNAYIIQSWRANIDVSPVLSKRALIQYLSKYISKSEPQSQGLIDLVNLIFAQEENLSVKSIIQRLFIHSVSERDFGAQEVCHLLMGLKLYHTGGRKIVNLYLGQSEWVNIDVQKRGKSIVEKYQERDLQYED
ncbi:hypothetical protein FOCC_FOCC014351, partial [Frankliniella occidentalis]